mgnify:CR=1 FL=1|jgi:hypothetical protein
MVAPYPAPTTDSNRGSLKFQSSQRKQCVGLSLDHPGGWFEVHQTKTKQRKDKIRNGL